MTWRGAATIRIAEGVSKRHLAITVPPTLHKVLSHLATQGHKGLVVGGAVRDALQGEQPHDLDVECYGVGYDDLAKTLSEHGRVNLVGKAFGVAKLRDADGQEYDFSLPRRDNKSGIGHRDFTVDFDPNITPKEAAARRDFTMNSMAWDPLSHELHDYHGGEQDLKDKVLRHTSSAFAEDPLRVLRGMQFSARYGMSIHPDTAKECQRIAPEYGTIPKERVSEEWMKLATKGTEPGRALSYLKDTGWSANFPEVHALYGTKQESEWHPEGDLEFHTAHTMNAAAKIADHEGLQGDDRATLVLGAMLHDVGKPSTTTQQGGRIISHGHDLAGGPLARKFLSDIGIKKDITDKVAPLVENHMQHLNYEKGISSRTVRRLAERLHPANIKELSMVMESDHSGRPPLPGGMPKGGQVMLDKASESRVTEKRQERLVEGRDVMPYHDNVPGPHIGEAVREAYEAQLNGDINNKDEAKRWLDAKFNKTSAKGSYITCVHCGGSGEPQYGEPFDHCVGCRGTGIQKIKEPCKHCGHERLNHGRGGYCITCWAQAEGAGASPEEASRAGWACPGFERTSSEMLTLYRGTTEKSWKRAQERGEFSNDSNWHTNVAAEVEKHYNLPEGSIANHEYYGFNSGFRKSDNELYVTPNYESAAHYAWAGNEPYEDAARTAHRIVHADMYDRNAQMVDDDTWTKEDAVAMKEHKEAFVEQYHKDSGMRPIVVHLSVPKSLAYPEPTHSWETKHLTLKRPFPTKYVTGVSYPDRPKPIFSSSGKTAAPEQVYYHTSPKEHRDSIQGEGIKPSQEGCVYLTDEEDFADDLARTWEDSDVWEVRVDPSKVKPDPEWYEDNGVDPEDSRWHMHDGPIPPTKIRRIGAKTASDIRDQLDLQTKECLYCHKTGHHFTECPKKPWEHQNWWGDHLENPAQADGWAMVKNIRTSIAPRRPYYHVAPEDARESIEQHGIDFSKGESPWEDRESLLPRNAPRGNYLYGDEEAAVDYAVNHEVAEMDNGGDDPRDYDIYKVDALGLQDIKRDPEDEDSHVMNCPECGGDDDPSCERCKGTGEIDADRWITPERISPDRVKRLGSLGKAFFEYHCYEGEDSNDAELWHRTHQPVTVERELGDDERDPTTGRSFRVRFDDGHQATAWHDELFHPTKKGQWHPQGEKPWRYEDGEQVEGDDPDYKPYRPDYSKQAHVETFKVRVGDLDFSRSCIDEYPDDFWSGPPDTWPHQHGPTDEDHERACKELGQMMKEGYDPGPVVVDKNPSGDKRWAVIDGMHRSYAAELAGIPEIDAIHARDDDQLSATHGKGWRTSGRTASWRDVRNKAVRLRRANMVNIILMDDDVIAADVQGDHGIYHVVLRRQYPGSYSITTWECSCKWGEWAFKRQHTYVGRLCSHALATLYEAHGREYKKKVSTTPPTLPLDDSNLRDHMETIHKRPAPSDAIGGVAEWHRGLHRSRTPNARTHNHEGWDVGFDTCRWCKGSGKYDPLHSDPDKTCGRCKGSGIAIEMKESQKKAAVAIQCWQCRGTGAWKNMCDRCFGEDVVDDEGVECPKCKGGMLRGTLTIPCKFCRGSGLLIPGDSDYDFAMVKNAVNQKTSHIPLDDDEEEPEEPEWHDTLYHVAPKMHRDLITAEGIGKYRPGNHDGRDPELNTVPTVWLFDDKAQADRWSDSTGDIWEVDTRKMDRNARYPEDHPVYPGERLALEPDSRWSGGKQGHNPASHVYPGIIPPHAIKLLTNGPATKEGKRFRTWLNLQKAASIGRGSLTFYPNSRRPVKINVEVAMDAGAIRQGLMYRPMLPMMSGMVFLYPFPPSYSGFWMKNTRIPLSVAFWDRAGRIIQIIDMEPCSDTGPCPAYKCKQPYWGAVEVNRGFFRQWGIGPGDKVELLQ